MIKYLFSDLDGTLYVDDNVSNEDRKSLWNFVKNGGIFSISTGRADFEIDIFTEEENLPKSFFKVSSNGANVIGNNKVILHNDPITDFASKEIYNFISKNINKFICIEFGDNSHLYYLHYPFNYTLKYKNKQYTIGEDNLKKLLEKETNIFKIYIESDKNTLLNFYKYIEKNIPKEVSIFDDLTAANLVKFGNNKGKGIKILLDKYNISPNEIAVIGDAANDIDMFSITPHSFTFNYAQNFVKDKANYIVNNVKESLDIIGKIK